MTVNEFRIYLWLDIANKCFLIYISYLYLITFIYIYTTWNDIYIYIYYIIGKFLLILLYHCLAPSHRGYVWITDEKYLWEESLPPVGMQIPYIKCKSVRRSKLCEIQVILFSTDVRTVRKNRKRNTNIYNFYILLLLHERLDFVWFLHDFVSYLIFSLFY